MISFIVESFHNYSIYMALDCLDVCVMVNIFVVTRVSHTLLVPLLTYSHYPFWHSEATTDSLLKLWKEISCIMLRTHL